MRVSVVAAGCGTYITLHHCAKYFAPHTMPLPHSCSSNRQPSKVAVFSTSPYFHYGTLQWYPIFSYRQQPVHCLATLMMHMRLSVCVAVGWKSKANKWGSSASRYLAVYAYIWLHVCVCVLVVECTCWKAVSVFVCGNNEAVCWYVHTVFAIEKMAGLFKSLGN